MCEWLRSWSTWTRGYRTNTEKTYQPGILEQRGHPDKNQRFGEIGPVNR